MKAERFFSMAYDIRHNPKIELLRMHGGMKAFGQWVALMGILYDVGGAYLLDKPQKKLYLAKELEMDGAADLDVFLTACADADLIDAGLLEGGSVASRGICEQLDYYRQKSEAGKRGGASRWAKKENGKR